jgi:hypothetical protein
MFETTTQVYIYIVIMCMQGWTEGWMDICIYVCTYVYVCVSLSVCMSVCMHACMHVCMYESLSLSLRCHLVKLETARGRGEHAVTKDGGNIMTQCMHVTN